MEKHGSSAEVRCMIIVDFCGQDVVVLDTCARVCTVVGDSNVEIGVCVFV